MRNMLMVTLLALLMLPALALGAEGESKTRRAPREGDRPKAQRERPNAQGEGAERERPVREDGERARRPQGHPLMGALAQLNLNEKQKLQVQNIIKAQREAAENNPNREKARELFAQLRKAHQAGDKEKVAELRKQLEELRKGGEGGGLIDEIKKVLTAEQVTRLDQILAERPKPGSRGEGGDRPAPDPTDGLKLSPEKKAQVKEILKAHHEEIQAYRKANEEKINQLREQMKAAREAKDREKMKQLMEQARALHEGGPSREALVEKLGKVLSEQELAQVKRRLAAIHEDRGPRRGPGEGDAERPRRRAEEGRDLQRRGPRGDKPGGDKPTGGSVDL